MTETISFKISGEFVTKLAREKYYQDNNIRAALELLTNSLQTDQLSKNQILIIALQILNYDADIVGTYPDNDYGVKFKEDIDQTACDMNNIINLFDQINNRNKATHDAYCDLLKKYLFICDHLHDYELTDINADYYNNTGEFLFPDIKTPAWKLAEYNNNSTSDDMLESFLAQKKREYENTDTEDYGWLDPDGNFYPVEWCHHDEWAREYLEEHYPFDNKYAHLYWKTDENNQRQHITAGDVLIYSLHWALLDNPYRGLANLQHDPARELTKAQKEFLYDYYIERDRHDDANRLYND